MLSSQITSADIAKLAGVTRHKVRSMLRDLPGFNNRRGQERVATEYNEHDLAVLAVCFELEERYGLRRDMLATLVGEIRNAFSGPKHLANGAFLLIVPHAATVRYLYRWSRIDDGLLFPLDPLIQRIDAYLGQRKQRTAQSTLMLGPVVVSGASPMRSADSRQDRRRAPRLGAAK